MSNVRYGYLSREYADRHMGAFRLNKPPMFERVTMAVQQGNHCFALIGKRSEVHRWLTEVHPEMTVGVTETFAWRKDSPYAGLFKVTVRSVHVGYRFFYLMFSKKLTNKLLVEFSPWDGKSKPGEPMPMERDDIDAIPLCGESILAKSGTTMAEISEKLKTKRKIMDTAGGVKVMGVRLERASTFSSVNKPKSDHGVTPGSGHSARSSIDEKTGEERKRRASSFSLTKILSREVATH